MRNPLVPVQRADKNGRVVTRHVKAGGVTPAAAPKLPSPTAGTTPAPSPKPLKKPTAKQLKREMKAPALLKELNYDPRVAELLGVTENLLYTKASEVETYDLLSVVSPDNALLFLEHSQSPDGARALTADEVVGMLMDNGLEELIVDRRDMMDEAVSRRISTNAFLSMHLRYNIEWHDPQRFVDAARLFDSTALGEVINKEGDPTFHTAILDGAIDYADVETLGLSFIGKQDRGVIFERLVMNKEGVLAYDVPLPKVLIEKSKHSRTSFLNAEEMVQEHGADYVRGIKDMDHAISVHRVFRGDTREYRQELINYRETDPESFMVVGTMDIVKLHAAGIDPKEAAELVRLQKMDADRIITLKQAGVEAPLATGWL